MPLMVKYSSVLGFDTRGLQSLLLTKSVIWNPKENMLPLTPAASVLRSQLCTLFMLHSLQGSVDESLSWPNNALSVPPLDPTRWDLAAMKFRILIVTRGRTAVEPYKWWRCRSPLNLHVDGGVCDCLPSWKLFVTVMTQYSLAPSPQLTEPQQQGLTGSQYGRSNDKLQKRNVGSFLKPDLNTLSLLW